MSGMKLLVNGSHGVYVPQVFFKSLDLDLWNGIDDEDSAILEDGPDHDQYWSVWDDILCNASFTHGGKTWKLWQDGDLWAYCEELMTDEEYFGFFGEHRSKFEFDSDSRWETDNWYDTSAELN